MSGPGWGLESITFAHPMNSKIDTIPFSQGKKQVQRSPATCPKTQSMRKVVLWFTFSLGGSGPVPRVVRDGGPLTPKHSGPTHSQTPYQNLPGCPLQPEAGLTSKAEGGPQRDPYICFLFSISECSLWIRAVTISQCVCLAWFES